MKRHHLPLWRQKFVFEDQLLQFRVSQRTSARRRQALCTWSAFYNEQRTCDVSNNKSHKDFVTFHVAKSSLTNEETFRRRPQLRWRARCPSKSTRCATPPWSPGSSRFSRLPVERIQISKIWHSRHLAPCPHDWCVELNWKPQKDRNCVPEKLFQS